MHKNPLNLCHKLKRVYRTSRAATRDLSPSLSHLSPPSPSALRLRHQYTDPHSRHHAATHLDGLETSNITSHIPIASTMAAQSSQSESAHPRRFPIEVEENIIDQASTERSVLKNCALVCRDWYPRSLYHLIRSIRVRSREDFLIFCEFFSRHKDLAELVRELEIAASPDYDDIAILQVAYVPLLSLLPRLKSYSLRDMRRSTTGTLTLPSGLVSWHPTTLVQFKAHLSVEELSLGPLLLCGYSELLHVILALRRTLRVVRCQNIRFASHAQPDWNVGETSLANKLRVSTLVVSGNLFLSNGVYQPLRTILVDSAYSFHASTLSFPWPAYSSVPVPLRCESCISTSPA